MIEIAQIEHHTYQSTHGTDGGGLEEAGHPALLDGDDQEGDDHGQDDEQVIIGHLHMVGIYLKGREHRRKDQAPKVLAPIGEHDAGYHGRQIGKGHHLPDVARGDDDEEIAAERPDDASQHSKVLAEVESAQQDVESQQIDKHVDDAHGQPELIHLLGALEHVLTLIRRRQLIGGHTAEEGVGPAGLLTRLGLILQKFPANATAGSGVVLEEDAAVDVGRHEIDKRDDGKQNHRQDVGETLLQCIHSL